VAMWPSTTCSRRPGTRSMYSWSEGGMCSILLGC
jgi:hypothetical protein